MNRANNPAFTWSNTFFLSRQQNRNLHPESTTKSHLHKKHFEKSLCFIPLSIPFLDTRSFCSVQESWNFPRRRIVAAFWEILISSLQRKGKGRGEGIGGVQQGGGVQTISIMAWYLMIKCLFYCNSSQPPVHSLLLCLPLFYAEHSVCLLSDTGGGGGGGASGIGCGWVCGLSGGRGGT